MNKALNYADRAMLGGLLLLVIFIPYSSAVIQAGLIVLLLGWLTRSYLMWKSNPHPGLWHSLAFPSSGLGWPLFMVGVLILVTLPMSYDPALGLKKFFSRFLQQIFLMYVVSSIIKTPKQLCLVLGALLLTLIVVNADIWVQFFSGQSFIFSSPIGLGRVNGPMRHPNDLASLLVAVLPLVLALIIARRFFVSLLSNPRFVTVFTVVSGIVFVLLVLALGLTASRGAWLAFAFTMLGFSFYLKRLRLMAGVIFVLIVFFFIFGVRCVNTRTDVFENKVEKFSVQELYSNSSSRMIYWKKAIDVFQRNPLYGCGYNAYIQALKDLKFGHEEYPHNSILHILAELGIIGTSAYLWFFFALFFIRAKQIFKTISMSKDLYVLGCGVYFGLMAWMIHSLMDTPWESLQLSILWWLFIGVFLSLPSVFQQLSRKEGA